MKKVSFAKIAVTLVAVVISVAMCVSPSWAASNDNDIDISLTNLIKMCLTPDVVNAGEDELVAAKNYLDTVWRSAGSFAGTVDVTYQTLSDVVSQLNLNGVPCQIRQLRGAGVTGYVIMGIGTASILDGYGRYNFSDKYFTNTAGAVFRAGKDDTNIDNSVTINKTTVVNNPYISQTVGTASKLVSDVTSGIKNIIDWLDLNVKAITLVNRRLDVTNDILAWMAENFQDMMYAIGQADLLIAEVGIEQLKELYRFEDMFVAINSNQIYSYYAQNSFFSSILSSVDKLISAADDTSTAVTARLDKLISMYSKVNSVVFDTASVNGGAVSDAVGGELKDVVFWGDTVKSGDQFLTPNGLFYRAGANANSTTLHTIDGDIVLRSVNMGAAVPDYISNDPVLYAGVWRKGTDYIISDTYNATTGEYVQRVAAVDIPVSASPFCGHFDDWTVYCIPVSELDVSIMSIPSRVIYTAFVLGFERGSYPATVAGRAEQVCVHDGYIKIMTQKDLRSSYLPSFVIMSSPISSNAGSAVISIPEGDSYISSSNVRITGKYETYDSYTQTADIISAINNINMGGGTTTVTADLTAVVSRLDTLIENSASKVENVTNVVIEETNNAYNVFYVTTDDGDKKSIGEVSGDALSASGKLLNFLYKLCFENALSKVDDSITNMDGFYFDNAAGLEGSIWD